MRERVVLAGILTATVVAVGYVAASSDALTVEGAPVAAVAPAYDLASHTATVAVATSARPLPGRGHHRLAPVDVVDAPDCHLITAPGRATSLAVHLLAPAAAWKPVRTSRGPPAA